MANSVTAPVVVRIDGKEWVLPLEVSFRSVLDVMAQIMPSLNPLPTAFEYEDDDGDRITVCSDEELAAMISFCQWRNTHLTRTQPLNIYPKAKKKKNKLNLEVNTRAPLSSNTISNPSSSESLHSRSGSFRRANEQTLIKLISEGQIARQDLQYLEILGHGNGGTVYRTFHQPSKVIMAVKVIALDATQEEQRQIMGELNILHKCDSSYIIGFYGAFFTENRISMCTEYMDGGSLENYGAIPEQILGRIIVRVVKGLNYLWSLKVMHRDIKPSNMLVNTQGCVKLCDFGVSVQLLTSLTKTFIGTNAYMAPERILGGEYGIHSEIWSLGISTLEMALGRFPYLPEGSKSSNLVPFELLQCIVNEKPPTLSPEDFSPPLIEFTQQCMQKLPKSRPGITALLQHPFLLHYDDGGEEVIAVWVRRILEQMRIMQRFPSDTSLASSTNSGSVASSWSGVSGSRSAGPLHHHHHPPHHPPPSPHIPPGTSHGSHTPSSAHHLMDTS